MNHYPTTTVALTELPRGNYRGEGKGREKEGKGTLTRPPSSVVAVQLHGCSSTNLTQTRARDTRNVDTHPHPDMIEPRNWCTNCHEYAADGILCPVCRDNQAHGINILITGAPQPQDGRGTN